MRSLVTYAATALAVLGLSAPGFGQRAASAEPKSLSQCQWQPLAQFSNTVPRALAVTPDGGLLLAADDLSDPAHATLVTLRWDGPGASWQVVDRYLPEGSTATGARALHVDAEGNAFVLAWEQRGSDTQLLLRRSFGAGDAGTWESGDERWEAQRGGGLTSAPDGRLFVAYGFREPGAAGWRVESALRGVGAFRVEDVLRRSGASTATPWDIEPAADGTLYVAGQVVGAATEWLVRARTPSAAWKTIDRYQIPATLYAAPRAVVSLGDGRIVVAGLTEQGSGPDEYRWLERWQNARGKWQARRYKLADGITAMAQDAVATSDGVAVLGSEMTAEGQYLVLRESSAEAGGARVLLKLGGITDPWSARLAIGPNLAAVAASVGGKATVLGCY